MKIQKLRIFIVFVARYRYPFKLAWSLQRKSPLIVTYISQNSVHLDLIQTGKLFRTKIDSPSLSHLISASFSHIYHFHLSEDQFHLLTHNLANDCTATELTGLCHSNDWSQSLCFIV